MFKEYIAGKLSVFAKELGEPTCRFRICGFMIFVRDVCSFSTIPGRHIPVFLVDANFLAVGDSPITLVEVGGKIP